MNGGLRHDRLGRNQTGDSGRAAKCTERAGTAAVEGSERGFGAGTDAAGGIAGVRHAARGPMRDLRGEDF